MDPSLRADIDAFGATLQPLIARAQADEAARKHLFGVVSNGFARLESPFEKCWRLIMAPHGPAALMALMDMGVVEKLAASTRPMTAHELAEPTGADPLLVSRLLRPMVPLGIVKEPAEGAYEPLPTLKVLTSPVMKGGFTFMFTCAAHALSQLPAYLRSTGYQNPMAAPGPFEFAKGSELSLFPWLIAHPPLMSHFNNFMAGKQAKRGAWFGGLPVADLFLDGARADPHAVLLVDMGGGKGHDLANFRRSFPDAPGRLVLQDLPEVIADIGATDLDAAITRMPHSFFDAQPVRAARAYYFRSVLHNHPDAAVVGMLTHVAAAMERGYSKLLLNEFVLPTVGVPLFPALHDINMMALQNSMERTEAQFAALLDRAGLRVVGVHRDPHIEAEGVIEAVLK